LYFFFPATSPPVQFGLPHLRAAFFFMKSEV
jgi:hypothetical protein